MDQTMEVTIDGKKQTVPICTCGKCIVRRLRNEFFTKLPYSKDMGTTYTKDFPWKTPLKTKGYYNRSMHTGFENSFKPSLPNGHISEMKAKYRPFSTDIMKFKQSGAATLYSEPFFSGTTYGQFFPNWGSITSAPPKEVPNTYISVPLRGNSNYRDNYIKHPDRFYQTRDPMLFNPSTLKFIGNIHPETTYRTDYKPIDFDQPAYFPKEKDDNPYLKSNAFLVPDNPQDLDTTYRDHYIKYEDGMCPLRKYLNKRGMRHLVI